MRWPKYWSFSFNVSPSNEHPGLISFRMDWLDLLAVQGTLNSFLQHHSSKASILQCSAFFTVQLSNPYMTTGKTVTLSRWTFVGKVISLNLSSRLFVLPAYLSCPILCFNDLCVTYFPSYALNISGKEPCTSHFCSTAKQNTHPTHTRPSGNARQGNEWIDLININYCFVY